MQLCMLWRDLGNQGEFAPREQVAPVEWEVPSKGKAFPNVLGDSKLRNIGTHFGKPYGHYHRFEEEDRCA